MRALRLAALLALLLLTAPAALTAATPEGGWIPLFDGKTLEGWKANESDTSFKVEDGAIVAQGPRAHLFYVGPVENARFRSFELRATVMTAPNANSGIYFHTQFEDEGWPSKGFEVQVYNGDGGHGDYRERKKSGSLYAIRNVHKTFARDGEWFDLRFRVQGRRVQVWLNDMMVVDHVEPKTPPRPESLAGRLLDEGTFALQCHDPGSRVSYRSIEVLPLPEGESDDLGPAEPVVDDAYKAILELGAGNYPLVDYHVHLKGDLTLDQALAISRRTGINFGIAANCGQGFPITDDAGALAYLETMKDQPVFVGMQAEGREWVTMFSRETMDRFDYVFTDAMTLTNDAGKRMRLWIPEEVEVGDKQAFMEMLVDRIVGIIENEPIDIYVNPTFLPDEIAGEYDALWTEARMDRVIAAAVRRGVAIEINSRLRLPGQAFVCKAKAAGATFALGTNNVDSQVGSIDYAIDMIRACGIEWKDMFVPQ